MCRGTAVTCSADRSPCATAQAGIGRARPAASSKKGGEWAGRSIPAERSGAGMGCSGEVECLGGSGSGLQGDFVAEGFELADVVALLTFWVDPGVVVAGSQVVVTGFGIG